MRVSPDPRIPGIAVSFAAALVSCAVLSPAPSIFPNSRPVVNLTFEEDPLNEPPRGLVSHSKGRWAVVDSPQAVSGSQVVVRRADTSSVLAVRDRSDRVGGEVSVRVLLGPSGAGLACETGEGTGYRFQVEPAESRIALYRGNGDEVARVAARTTKTRKGKWTRLGLVCEASGVTAYLDGRPVLRHSGGVGPARLALWVDPGVTAQFDDLSYVLGATESR